VVGAGAVDPARIRDVSFTTRLGDGTRLASHDVLGLKPPEQNAAGAFMVRRPHSAAPVVKEPPNSPMPGSGSPGAVAGVQAIPKLC
jgi:hypothetical protein